MDGRRGKKPQGEPSFLFAVLGVTLDRHKQAYCLGGRMASLASFSRMGARRLATVAARTAPRASMQVCKNTVSQRNLFWLGVRCDFRAGTFGVQSAGTRFVVLGIRRGRTKAKTRLPATGGYRFTTLRQCSKHRQSCGVSPIYAICRTNALFVLHKVRSSRGRHREITACKAPLATPAR